MDNELAQAACDSYNEIIRRYLNPAIAPKLIQIIRDLYSACDYLNQIPREQRTPEQDQLRIRISGLLLMED